MPGASFMGPDKVKAQLAKGAISEAQIDESILRMLRPMFAVGLFDAPEGSYDISKHAVNASTAESIAVAKQPGAATRFEEATASRSCSTRP